MTSAYSPTPDPYLPALPTPSISMLLHLALTVALLPPQEATLDYTSSGQAVQLPASGARSGPIRLAADGPYLFVGVPDWYESNYNGAVLMFSISQAGSFNPLDSYAIQGSGSLGSQFGYALVVTEDEVIVGQPGTTQGVAQKGRVFAYPRTLGVPTTSSYDDVSPQGAQAHERFGASIAALGNTMVVGAPNRFVQVPSAGAAYVFTRTEVTGWTLSAVLESPLPASAQLGKSVAISDDHIAVAGSGIALLYERTTSGGWAVTDSFATANTPDLQFHDGELFSRSATNAVEQFPGITQGVLEPPRALTPSDGATTGFGSSICVFDDKVIIGSPTTADRGTDTGAIYVFTRDLATGTYSEQTKILARDPQPGNRFGEAVAASDFAYMGGAPGASQGKGSVSQSIRQSTWGLASDRVELNPGSTSSAFLGSAFDATEDSLIAAQLGFDVGTRSVTFFERTGDAIEEQAHFSADTDQNSHKFGASVAISGDWAAVGAPGDSDQFISGRVYIYRRASLASWELDGTLTIPTDVYGSLFGSSVAMSGPTLAVGEPGFPLPGQFVGRVQTFRLDEFGAWVLEASADSVAAIQGAEFGAAVDMSGDHLIVGAPHLSTAGLGRVHLFERTTSGAWGEVAFPQPVAETGEGVGTVVAIDGDFAAVGAPTDNDRGLEAGSIFVYERDEVWGWQATGQIYAPDASQLDHFGDSLAFSGEQLLVGASGAVGERGSFYVYSRDASGQWSFDSQIVGIDSSSTLPRASAVAGGNGYWYYARPGLEDGRGGIEIVEDDWLLHGPVADDPVGGSLQALQLRGGLDRANQLFVLLGSASGTAPGINVGGVQVPLVIDAYTNYLLSASGGVVLQPWLGLLDDSGSAQSRVWFPPAAALLLAGVTLHHSAVLFDPTTLGALEASRPIPFLLGTP